MRVGLLVGLMTACVWSLGLDTAPVSAADHRVEPLNEKAPEGLSDAVASQLAPTGFKVVRGTSRTVCEIWLAKQWTVKSLKASGDVYYPFTPGQLIGVVHYPNKGSDFRDQDIDEGLYTLRYAQQPVDGAHIGTSPTRDFLLLVRAEADKSADVLDYKTLTAESIKAARTAHPAMLSLQKAGEEGEAPSISHEEDKDWWLVRLEGEAVADDQRAKLPLELVVVGVAEE